MMAHRVKQDEDDVGSSESDNEEATEEAESNFDDNESSTPLKVEPSTSIALQREEVDSPAASSPAPAPIKGGENEVVRLSHIASIEVKDTKPSDATTTSGAATSASATTPTAATTAATRSASPVSSKTNPQNGKEHNGSNNHNNRTSSSSSSSHTLTPRYSTRTLHRVHMADDDLDNGSDCAPMDSIEKSPYEPALNAEKGVKIFSDMRSILAESDNDDYRTVSPQATKIFGPTNAWSLVKANTLIEKSGMVYSQEWVNGNIRGNLVGKLPNDLLILCFVSKRFVKAGELLLAGLTRDLKVYEIVKEALKEWNLTDTYKRIASSTKNFQFSSKRRDCFKCEIFVARTYCCHKAFGSKIEASLLSKVKTCLDMMESKIPEHNTSKKRKKSTETAASVAATAAAAAAASAATTNDGPSETAATTKRRRGRPPKSRASTSSADAAAAHHSSAAAPKPPSDDFLHETASQMSDSGESGYDPSPHQKSSYSSSRARRPASNSNSYQQNYVNGKKLSVSRLLARLEEQYEEMGERYREMGETLSILKTKIDERTEKTEQEIRNELLQEVQKTIMSSFPRK